jgi:beta-lactamase class A
MPREFGGPFPGTLEIYAQRLGDRAPFAVREPYDALPAASVIKLVILVGIVREIDAGRLRWESTLRIASPQIVGASESFGTARAGQAATVRRLATAMVVQSDNTAGNVLADHLSFAGVNAVARSLGLARTAMRRHFMDFAVRARGIDNTTSAWDMGRLLLAIERGARGLPTSVASGASCRAIVDTMLRQEDRVTIPDGIDRRVPIANKTGVLPDVRNDVAIVDPYGKNPYVVALISRFPQGMTLEAYADLRAVAGDVDRRARS